MVTLQTQPEQLSNLAGPQLQQLQQMLQTLPTTQLPTLQELVILTKPMATPSLMVTDTFSLQATTMSHTSILEAKLLQFVDLPRKLLKC